MIIFISFIRIFTCYIYIITLLYLCGYSFCEVGLHVFLDVEVGNRISLSNIEKFAEFLVRKNNATVLFVLEGVVFNVFREVFGYFGARDFSAVLESHECA